MKLATLIMLTTVSPFAVCAQNVQGGELFNDPKKIIRYGVQEVSGKEGRSNVWQVEPGSVSCRSEEKLRLGNVWTFSGVIDGSQFHRGPLRISGEINPEENNRPALVFGGKYNEKEKVAGGCVLLLCEGKQAGTVLHYKDLTVQGKGSRILASNQGGPGFPETGEDWVPFRVLIDGTRLRYEVRGTTITDVTIEGMDSQGFIGVHCLYDHPRYPLIQVDLRNLTVDGAKKAVSTAMAQNSSSTETILPGEWSVKIGNYEDIWTFQGNGDVTSDKEPNIKGVWTVETHCILIQWDAVYKSKFKPWDAFNLPLKEEGTPGGNWHGQKIFVKKLAPRTPE